MSELIGPQLKLLAALAKAQPNIKNPPLDSFNPHFKAKFASLAAVKEAVIPPLNAEGIVVLQRVESVEGGVSCQTVFIHAASGEYYDFPVLTVPAKGDAQGVGSGAAYARRYSLQAAGGVVGEEDDDGAGAKGESKNPAAKLTEKQVAELQTFATSIGVDQEKFFKVLNKKFGGSAVKAYSDIPASEYDTVMGLLKQKQAQQLNGDVPQ